MSLLSYLRTTSAPAAAVELAADRVAAARIELRAGAPIVAAHAAEPLPPGALVPSLTAVNVQDKVRVERTVARVLDRIGSPRRVGLVVPDLVAKVSLVRFEQVPERPQDLDQLVHWQMRKSAPFPIESAQITYVPGARTSEGQEFVVALAKREVVEEYERLVTEAGAHAGIVDLATFNVINVVLAAPPSARPAGDWLLINVATDYASIAIVRGPHLIFLRNRVFEADGSLSDLVHQSMMYYQDRIKGSGIARAILAGAAAVGTQTDVDVLRRSLEDRVNVSIEPVDPRTAAGLADRIAAAPALLDTLAPLVGLMLRSQEQAA
jgi:Tfp pilus assembly PilM family ATPase